MKDFRFRRLERHRIGGSGDRMHLSYPPPRTPSGKVYQYSPNPEAAPRLFLIGDAPSERNIAPENSHRIRRQPGPGHTVCPYSGHVAPDEEFIHFDDIEAVKKLVVADATSDVHDWLADLARDFNRGQRRNSFLQVKMDVKSTPRPRPLVIREDLLRDLQCDICQRPYAVYALALFCPDCGAPNVALHFRREVSLVAEQVALADAQNLAGKSELAYRLMGNAHEDVLTAFEAALKAIYRYLVRQRLPHQAEELCSSRAIGNAFQNADRVKEKFGVLEIDPFEGISQDDLAQLRLNVEKRHVIGHNLGVADERYVELTRAEQPGETVRLIGEDIDRFAALCLGVVSSLEEQLLPAERR